MCKLLKSLKSIINRNIIVMFRIKGIWSSRMVLANSIGIRKISSYAPIFITKSNLDKSVFPKKKTLEKNLKISSL